MHIIIFTHPDFTGAFSIDKYTSMIAAGLKKRGHEVQVISASPILYNFSISNPFKKWLGYIDQFLLFPALFRIKSFRFNSKTLFVFADQALGPWIPLVSKRPHIIHCHDFLAQRSADGEFSENKLSWSGKIYQRLIRQGFRKGENFISISEKTRNDLHKYLDHPPKFSEVVYNGLNQKFEPGDKKLALRKLEKELKLKLSSGYILHVGGNQFYKNRKGVIEIYQAWRREFNKEVPLIMVGPSPTKELVNLKKLSDFENNIHFVTNLSDELLKMIYRAATVFLFPSIEEGFGWPIAEAMASGSVVLTTNKAPMTEVGGKACFYLPTLDEAEISREQWATLCALELNRVYDLPLETYTLKILEGLERAKKFDPELALDKIEEFYYQVINIRFPETVFNTPTNF